MLLFGSLNYFAVSGVFRQALDVIRKNVCLKSSSWEPCNSTEYSKSFNDKKWLLDKSHTWTDHEWFI